jgi:hypothetical protein
MLSLLVQMLNTQVLKLGDGWLFWLGDGWLSFGKSGYVGSAAACYGSTLVCPSNTLYPAKNINILISLQ